ncbi:non-ribosomal peptide synthetase, partial [Bacteroides ovatus]|uniref:non-ribosomal peptide synthetase n=1 Tax=Bacteroides ovatus TaxID=28116 RepID=UPI000FF2BF74
MNRIEVEIEPEHAYKATQKYLQENQSLHAEFWKNYINRADSKENLSVLLKEEHKHLNLSDYRHITEPDSSSLTISDLLYNRIKELSQNNAVTVSSILNYCWHKIISTYSGMSTTTIGVVLSGRNIPVNGIEKSVGLYINTLPVIFDHTINKTVIESIQHLQNDINEINTRTCINLSSLQSRGERVFNTLFVYENYPTLISQDCELPLTVWESREKVDYPLEIVSFEKEKKITILINYAAELFANDTIQMLLNCMKHLIQQIVEQPYADVAKLLCIEYTAVDKVVHKWNSTKKDYPRDKTIIDLFKEQVNKTPDNIALVCEGEYLTYKDVDDKSDRLAGFLSSQYSISEDNNIIISMNRSQYMLISILGVLKTGAAYVPISPQYPQERILHILSDTHSKVILTDEFNMETIEQIAPRVSVACIMVNSDFLGDIARFKDFRINSSLVVPENLAYIIYTSGTSGNPKGVMITHNNVCNYLFNLNEVIPPDVVNVDFSSELSFDLSVSTTLYPLCFGKCIAIFSHDHKDVELYEEHLIHNKVDLIKSTPSYLSLLKDTESLHSKVVIVGGEKLSRKYANQILKYCDFILDEYGPTETTVGTTYYKITSCSDPLLIGKPYYNTTAYVLDHNMHPVPIGVIGELYVG